VKKEFKLGQVVRLNSGGPKMTVQRLCDNDRVECVWFTPTGEFETSAGPSKTVWSFRSERDVFHVNVLTEA